MDIEIISFLALSLLINVSPGPGNIYILSYSLRYGIKAGMLSTIGITAGCLVVVLIAAFGITSLLEIYPNAIVVVQIAGGIYVIYLAIVMWPRATSRSNKEQCINKVSYTLLFKQGFVNSLLNPIDILFYTAIVPSFVPKDIVGHNYQIYFLFLAFTYVLIAFLAKCVFSVFAGFSRDIFFSNRAELVNYFSATLLCALGCFLVGKSAFDLLT